MSYICYIFEYRKEIIALKIHKMTHFNILVNGKVEETEVTKSDKVGFTFEMLFDVYNKKQDKFDKVQLTKWTQGEKELTVLKER